MIVLAGDVGGSSSRLVLSRVETGEHGLYERRYDNRAWTGFSLMLKDFLSRLRERSLPVPERACFGAAGPVEKRRCQLTNLPWTLDANELSYLLGDIPVHLVNDFVALGHAIPVLTAEEYDELHAGNERRQGVKGIVGAGTGLGHGILVWRGTGYRPLATEGGHAGFAPSSAVQVELLSYLLQIHTVVTIEDVLSGPGLVNIHRFVHERRRSGSTVGRSGVVLVTDDAATISRSGLQGHDAITREAVEIFVEIYGTHVRDFSLTCLPFGGLYIAGGIAPQLLRRDPMRRRFLKACAGRGKMIRLLQRIPVRLVTNERVGLRGAALAAAAFDH